jgi:solute carrier family 25 carnitine/acylcarnitine transporter 20/29
VQGAAKPPPGAAYSAAEIRAGRVLFNGPLDVLRHVARHEGGVRAVYRGLGATLLREVGCLPWAACRARGAGL